ncbi:unnamed protein product [Ranitomeya imitator]|uniref:CCHC-type domain-containing protein n=1 Tax=Ranitomeya imitator TaxID=111125 RepID=A0ABN9M9G3_9NEOB|nr:unnamed protein product [Ranitomeya imitator]
MLREYEDAGKALTGLKEELREARVLNTRASNKEKPATSQRFRALKDEMVRLVLLREGIEKSAAREEEDDVAVTGVLQAGTSRESESQSRQQGSGLPARQRTPTAQAVVSAEEEEEGGLLEEEEEEGGLLEEEEEEGGLLEEEEEEGGLLEEIRQLESPVNLDRFSFGEDEPAEESKKRKKTTKETAREVVSYRYVLMDDVTPTASCVNPTKPKGTGSAVGPGHRQGGERRMSGGAAVCAGNSAGGEAVEVLTAPDIGDPEEFPSLPSAAKPVITGAEGGEGDVHAVAKGGRCGQTPSLLTTAEPADAGAVGGRSEKLGAAKGGRTGVTGVQCASTEKRHAAAKKGDEKAGQIICREHWAPCSGGRTECSSPNVTPGPRVTVGAGQAAPPNKQQAQNNKIQTAAVGGQGAPETQHSTNQGKPGVVLHPSPGPAGVSAEKPDTSEDGMDVTVLVVQRTLGKMVVTILQRFLDALRRGESSINVEGREVDLSFWIERHGFSAFRDRGAETVWSLPTPGQRSNRRNVARLQWVSKDACPDRSKVAELLLGMGFAAYDIFALIHPYGTSYFDVSFVRPEGFELFWSRHELAWGRPEWRGFLPVAISRQNSVRRVTVLTSNESLSCVDISTWVGRYGDIVGIPEKTLDEHGIWSGAWTFMVKLKVSGNTVTHIPSSTFLGRDRILIFYRGQPKVCHRCGSPTHFSAQCTTQKCALCGDLGHLAATCGRIRCNLCGDLGHPFSRCPRSFANAVLKAASAGQAKAGTNLAGEGTSRGGGGREPVRSRLPPSNIRRQEQHHGNSGQGVMTLNSDPGASLAAEDPKDSELSEEVKRVEREEQKDAMSAQEPSSGDSLDEGEGEWSQQKKKGNRKTTKDKRGSGPRASSLECDPSDSIALIQVPLEGPAAPPSGGSL